MKKKILNIIIILFIIPEFLYSQDYPVSGMKMKPVRSWELSALFDISGIKLDEYPHFFTIFNARWDTAVQDETGWINIEKNRGIADMSAYGAYARSLFICQDQLKYKLNIQFSEKTGIFLNGRFIAAKDIRTDTPSGITEIEFTARKGLNELFLFIVSSSKDWKFRITSEPELIPLHSDHSGSRVVWETESSMLTPESVIYDQERDLYYVSNYDYLYYTKGYPTGYITRISPDGRIIDKEWIKGLFAPTGMCVIGNRLYIVVRNGLVVVGTRKGNYITQYDVPEAVFLNDATADSAGRIYITDSSGDPAKPDIYILENKQVKPWLQSDEISNANGIHEYHGKLYIGNNGEGLFQSIDIKDKKITTICSLGKGTIDGIRIDNAGNWLVSDWEGKIFRISHSGMITEIFDTRSESYNAADFEFSAKSNTIIIPAFLGNKVAALKIQQP